MNEYSLAKVQILIICCTASALSIGRFLVLCFSWFVKND